MKLSESEEEIKNKLRILKGENGLHSASVNEIELLIKREITIDACFLSNPYSQELAYKWLEKDIKKQLKNYPPSHSFLAKKIGEWRNLDPSRIIVGNGATELIYHILNTIKNKKIVIPIPSFSTYYELLEKENDIIYYQLESYNEYIVEIDVIIRLIQKEMPHYVILINPSNPTGQLLHPEELKTIHKSMSSTQILIIDESFIDFSDGDMSLESYAALYNNITIIRSLSKDFGLAGLRLGYSFLPHTIKNKLSASSFLWNINGLASVFCTYLSNKKFIEEYQECKAKYIEDKQNFYRKLSALPFKVYNSSANFFLIKPDMSAENLFVRLIHKHGIYTRLLNDKIGLDANYLRVASKDSIENQKIFNALKSELLQTAK
ncbi:pyridoxal phosphate-dependent aminotransferase [Chryseobacterium sp. JK1]|uniref:pyridoxal phosphate-dependent aminotransferase n=1 Tax=Chryseobacterium sp. JK1 TaxID=874294 RepID=UPI003D68E7B2